MTNLPSGLKSKNLKVGITLNGAPSKSDKKAQTAQIMTGQKSSQKGTDLENKKEKQEKMCDQGMFQKMKKWFHKERDGSLPDGSGCKSWQIDCTVRRNQKPSQRNSLCGKKAIFAPQWHAHRPHSR